MDKQLALSPSLSLSHKFCLREKEKMTSTYLYARFLKNNLTYSLRFKIITMKEKFYPSKRIHIFFRGDCYNKIKLAKRNFVKIGKDVNEDELFRMLNGKLLKNIIFNLTP